MADLTFADCQCFAGGLTLGAVQAGFTLVAKREERGAFGVPNCEANRGLLGSSWQAQSSDPQEWEPRDVDVVFSNPPCSAFSLMSDKAFRGVDSPINGCMRNVMMFAAKCDSQVVVMESVSQAFTMGRPLMQWLRADLAERTRERWTAFHVLHNAASVGGCAIRKRYFLVLVRGDRAFGVDHPKLERLPTLLDAIGDLAELPQTWEAQPYRQAASWWAEPLRSASGVVDGHDARRTAYARRIEDLLADLDWGPRENLTSVLQRYWAKFGRLPASWDYVVDTLSDPERNFKLGFSQPCRWRGDQMARVVTGSGPTIAVHPTQPRFFTNREIARVMGFPDDWLIHPIRGYSKLAATHGKGVTVQCGRWIGDWVRRSLEETPGDDRGELIGEDEYLIDVSRAYKELTAER